MAGQLKKGGGSGSKKSKKDVECFNCDKKGHYKRDCWAPGGGAEGKGPENRKGMQKEKAAKTNVKDDDEDADAVWMVNAEINVRSWLADFGDEEFEFWEEQESVGESWEKNWISDDTDDEYHAGPSNHANHVDDSMPDLVPNSPFETLSESNTSESDASKIFETDVSQVNKSVTEHSDNDLDSLPDLVSISDSSGESSVDEDDDENGRVNDDGLEVTYTDDIIIDNGGET